MATLTLDGAPYLNRSLGSMNFVGFTFLSWWQSAEGTAAPALAGLLI